MFRDRLAIAILLVPVTLWIVEVGGLLYALCVGAMLALAGAEYVRLFRRGGHRPAMPLVTVGVVAMMLARYFGGSQTTLTVLSLAAVLAAAWHLTEYERGAPASGTDFAITLGGITYLGLLGGYLVSLRQLPDGKWWTLLVLPGVWLVDSGAYSIGRAFGRHKMVPRLSPHKTWEGYAGGILSGILLVALFGGIWRVGAGPGSQITVLNGALMGGVLGIVTPVGDLAISMMKRQFSLKDTGALLAGHGGALDRIDSWLVAGWVGYLLADWMQR